VAEQSRENIHSISTLKDFQYIEEGKDQGINVREKAKAMVALLKDDERLRNERVRALKAKERFAQSVSGITGDPSGRNNNIEELTITVDGDQWVFRGGLSLVLANATTSLIGRLELGVYCTATADITLAVWLFSLSPTQDINSPTSPTYPGTLVTSSSRTERDSYGVRERPTDYGELESARPHTVGEEELQLQLALAMSKEEADHEEARRRSDDVRLQMALNESKDEKSDDGSLVERQGRQEPQDRSGINDLLDINFNPPQNNGAMLGAVGGLGLGSPLSPPSASRDPWGLSPPGAPSNDDPQGSRKSFFLSPPSSSLSVSVQPTTSQPETKDSSHNPFSTPSFHPPNLNTVSYAKSRPLKINSGDYPTWDNFKEVFDDSNIFQGSDSNVTTRVSDSSTRPMSSFISSSASSAKEQVLSNPRFSLANPFLCDLLFEADEEPSTSESSIFDQKSSFSHVTHPNLIPPPRGAPSAGPKNSLTLPSLAIKKAQAPKPESAPWLSNEFQAEKNAPLKPIEGVFKSTQKSSVSSSTVHTVTNISSSESFTTTNFSPPQSSPFSPSSTSFTDANRRETSSFASVRAKNYYSSTIFSTQGLYEEVGINNRMNPAARSLPPIPPISIDTDPMDPYSNEPIYAAVNKSPVNSFDPFKPADNPYENQVSSQTSRDTHGNNSVDDWLRTDASIGGAAAAVGYENASTADLLRMYENIDKNQGNVDYENNVAAVQDLVSVMLLLSPWDSDFAAFCHVAPNICQTFSCKVDAWGVPASKQQSVSPPPLAAPKVNVLPSAGNDPWAPVPAPAPAPVPTADPWAAVKSTSPLENSQPDPFAPLSIQQQPQQLLPLDDFSALTNREKPTANDAVFNLTGLDDALPSASRASPAKSRSPASFLGENSNLVNLDNLVASKSSAAGMASSSTLSSSSPNLNAAGVGKSFSLTPQPNTLLFSSTNTLNTSNTNPFTASGTPGISPIINYNNNNNNNMNVALSSGFAYGLSTGASNVHRSMSPLPTSVSGLGTSFYSASPPLTLTNTTAINNNNNNNNSLVIDSSIPSLSQDSFTGANPFCGSMMGGAVGGLGGTGGGAGGIVPNPFQAAQSPKPSINQLRASAGGGFNDPWGAAPQNNGIDGLTGKGNDPF
ncbi:ENTH domain, partial [Trinorchestia longiramus]